MNKKLLAALFVCTLIPWILGNGLLPLLPIYAIQLGASQTMAGYFMSFAFLSLALGAPIAGWLSDRIQRRKILITVIGILEVPMVFLASKATTVLQLALLTCFSWLLFGMGLALISTIAGIFAEKADRGKIFGLLGTTVGIGALIGGLITGPLVDRHGYSYMFLVLSVIVLVLPIASLFLKDKVLTRSSISKLQTSKGNLRLETALLVLLMAHAIAMVANGFGNMGRSLIMNSLNFSSAGITSTMIVSGLVLIPSGFIIGWLSDRMGRKLLILLSYFAFAISLLILNWSTLLWHFLVVSGLMSIAFISNSVGAAMVTDLADPDRLGLSMSLFQDMFWIGNVAGFAISGLMIQRFGISRTLLLGILPPSAAIILLLLVRTRKATTTPP